MLVDEDHKKTLFPEWTVSEVIELDDICTSRITELDYLCSKKIPYEKFEFLYLGGFDFKSVLFAVQYKSNNVNYSKILTDESQQDFAYQLYKKAIQK